MIYIGVYEIYKGVGPLVIVHGLISKFNFHKSDALRNIRK